ncbi:MAG: hypothetical protein PHF33_02010 [Candidatus Delongbacteria bacterium]|nr:hypothetical protein [Candidatus Delongbacteria bacterium]MDD4205323.1 hypothetical protein [Candidatus Delongbacteria bacterium]
MKRTITTIFMIAVMISAAYSDPGMKFSGLNDLLLAQDGTEGSSLETEGITPRIKSKKKAEYRDGKSPLVAAGLSLLVPGAGEFYGKDYIRSGVFFGIEVFTLSMWYYYESDGDDRRDEYRDYADANFDEQLYYGGLLGMTQNVISWLQNKNSLVPGDEFNAADYWSYEYFSDRDNWTHELKDSLAVYDFLALSYKEGFNGLPLQLEGNANQFTHNLPETKTQQYYEMIGKYHQFSCGWNDFNGYDYNADGTVVMVQDSIMASDGTYQVLERPKLKDGVFDYTENGYTSPQVDFYEDLRNKTNEAYEMGQNFLMVTLLNHVASAFDASYVIKKKYQIDTQLRIENSEKGEAIGLENYKVTYSLRW